MTEAPKTQYCHSLTEETFSGHHVSLEAAQAAAIEELEDQGAPGTVRAYWVGEISHPIDVYGEPSLAKSIGQEVVDTLVMWCDEEVGAEVPCLELSIDDKRELGEMIVKFFKERSAIQWYGVKNIQRFEHTVSAVAAQ